MEGLGRQVESGDALLGQARLLLESAPEGSAEDGSHEQGYGCGDGHPHPDRAAGDPGGQSGGPDLGAATGGQGRPRQRLPESIRQSRQVFDLSPGAGRHGGPVLGVEGGIKELGQEVLVPLRALWGHTRTSPRRASSALS